MENPLPLPVLVWHFLIQTSQSYDKESQEGHCKPGKTFSMNDMHRCCTLPVLCMMSMSFSEKKKKKNIMAASAIIFWID